MDKKKFVVSTLSNVYNQEKYIADTLEGFLMQKTDFGFECLIHDDASTDKTPEIIRKYEKKYPDIIKPIYNKENQYSKHVFLEEKFHYPRARGKYIAECEGDDYWIDPYKLAKQVDAMESHPEVDICAHTAKVEVNGKIVEELCPKHEGDIIPIEQVITDGGGFVATCSLMYRKSVVEDIPPFHKIDIVDYGMQILGALRGGMLYLDDPMAVYRYMADGSWSVRMYKSNERKLYNANLMLSMLKQLDIDTNEKFHDSVLYAEHKQEFDILKVNGDFKAMKQPPYDELYKNMDAGEKRRLFENTYLPFLVNAKRKMLSWKNNRE